MKNVKVIGLIVLILFSICCNQSSFSQVFKTDTIIKEDSMNLAILIVDFMTYQFESASISYYSKCNDYCDSDSLPFYMYFDGWYDFATVYFYYKFDSSLLFKAGIHWMGMGQIEYPTNFIPAQNFPYVSNTVPLPENAEYYNTTIAGNYCTWEEYMQRAQVAWQVIDSLELTNIFAEEQFRVGLYGYSRTEGLFNPYNADWIIFLYRGNTFPPFSIDKIDMSFLSIYPNPSNGIIHFPNEVNPLKIEIFNPFGQKLEEIRSFNTGNVDVSYLPNGTYLVKIIMNEKVNFSKVSIIH